MSTIIIVSVCAAVAAIIGLRVYFEHKEEKELEKQKQELENERENAARFILEELLVSNQTIAIEEIPQNQPKADVPNPTVTEIEDINSAEALKETKPKAKKKKRYYGKQKPKIKAPKK